MQSVFWKEKEKEFPKLCKIALAVLAVPATTAPVERIFSQAGMSTGGKRDRLNDENFVREVMIRVNKWLLERFQAETFVDCFSVKCYIHIWNFSGF